MKPQSEWTKKDWERALRKVAGRLQSIEKRVVSLLLERAQFRRNNNAYKKGKTDYKQAKPGESFLDARLREYEEVDARAGRYKAHEEVPFNQDLPEPDRKVVVSPKDRYSGVTLEEDNRIDITPKIYKKYQNILNHLCIAGNDKDQQGSATEWDIPLLRALSERIHYGAMYVAECKFNMDPEGYTKLIKAGDRKGLKKKLRRKKIELEIYARVRERVNNEQKSEDKKVRRIINPQNVVRFYRNVIIPLTLEGEVEYLMQKKID